MLKYIYPIIIALCIVSCKKPVLSGGYESSKVHVEFNHTPSGSSGGVSLDTDLGISERQIDTQGSGYGKTTQHYTVTNVTSTDFKLDYAITIENPRGSTPHPYSGSILVPYNEAVVTLIADNYNLTISTSKPKL